MNVQNTPSHSAYAETAEEAIAAQDALDNATITSEEATDIAMQNTLLTPRFYTTDFDEMDAIDVTPVRDTWDELIAEMKSDPNKGHFKKTDAWEADWDGMDPALKAEFIDFLISSCTAEFSGCVLYKEMKRRGSNSEFHQRRPARGRHPREPRISDTAEEIHVFPAQVHLLRDLSVGENRLRPLHHHLPPS